MITKRVGVRHAVSALVVLAGLGLAVRRGAADAPTDQYTTSNGTVTDTRTGLVWQLTPPAGSYAWADASTYCASNTGLSGSGWRLPSLPELQTIVDDSRKNPAIDPTFSNAPADYFWTSSTYAPMAGSAWLVNFYDGNTGGIPATSTFRVRCVR